MHAQAFVHTWQSGHLYKPNPHTFGHVIAMMQPDPMSQVIEIIMKFKIDRLYISFSGKNAIEKKINK